MARNKMTTRTAGRTTPPPKAQAKITSLKGLKSIKVWKSLVAVFDREPSPALLRLNKKKVAANYLPDQKKYQAEVRVTEKSPKLSVKVLKNWYPYPNSLVRYYILIIMEIPGPPTTVVNPPTTPKPPPSPL